jgi:DNA-binding HxlR family transcriptional regulator
MAQTGKDILEPLALMCKGEHAKAARELLTRVGDKWSILLVVMLARTPRNRARFSELQRLVDGISQRMLTTTLRNLERDGFLTREVFPEVPPRVEYELTALGVGLLHPMQHLVQWVGGNWAAIKEARERFDKGAAVAHKPRARAFQRRGTGQSLSTTRIRVQK